MAYLSPEFQHDIFVSYSHGNVDSGGPSPLKAWSQAFANDLQNELRSIPGFEEAKIFLDESKRPKHGLDRADPLTEQLRERVKGAALLLVLMSPRYVKSAWCVDERKWWLEKIADDPFPGLGNRVFVARIMPVPRENWPGELCDERGEPPLGYCLHSGPDHKIPNLPFGWGGSSHGDDYVAERVRLAGDIGKRIEMLRGALERRRKAKEEAERLMADGGQLLYLHGLAQDQRRWETAFEALLDAGYGVLPTTPETDVSPDPVKEEQRVTTLASCDGLLIVPSDDRDALERDLAVVGHFRRKSACAKVSKPLPCAVVDPGIALPDVPHLRRTAQNLRIGWLDATSPAWAETTVRPWLAAAGQAR